MFDKFTVTKVFKVATSRFITLQLQQSGFSFSCKDIVGGCVSIISIEQKSLFDRRYLCGKYRTADCRIRMFLTFIIFNKVKHHRVYAAIIIYIGCKQLHRLAGIDLIFTI